MISKKKKGKLKFIVADPAHAILRIDEDTFKKYWFSSSLNTGIVLLLEPTPDFYKKKSIEKNGKSVMFLMRYLHPFKKYTFRIIIGMFLASIISFSLPFFTQILVDDGIGQKNISLIYVILLSQLILSISSIFNDIIRSWILLHLNAKISLRIISDFLTKLLKLPIRFFDSKAVGDIAQRMNDHHRIESFLTGSLISTFFSFINMLVFGIILFIYNKFIFFVFIIFSITALLWVSLFQKRRKTIDYTRFSKSSESQDKLYEMITAMQEIKLFGIEDKKQTEWESIQINFFKLNVKSLSNDQLQQTGFLFFNSLKNITISFMAAQEVTRGNISLGILLSISYIVGQINAPIEQIVSFIKSSQDALLSIERLQEVFHKKEEDDENKISSKVFLNNDINLNNIFFQYEGPDSPFVLKDISFSVPRGKTTAIVGISGSGKTTLLKLLLGFYKPTSGNIKIGDTDLELISPKIWRSLCGTVMQDGYIFNDTIERNIAVGDDEIDFSKMELAVNISNIKSYIEGLSLSYSTKIGTSGIGISGGQKQRILLARAIYKDPEFLLFDEATSSLDANNEKQIIDNLVNYYKEKTVIIIAHRLSTVKNADQIIVLENGMLVEQGNHYSLVKAKGKYFELVQNQLDLE